MTELGGVLPYVIIANAAVVAVVLVAIAAVVAHRGLREVPGPVQNALERGLEWFVGLTRRARPDGVTALVPFLASLFAFILACNLLLVVPVPVLRIPPTAYYGTTLALALIAVIGALAFGVRFRGLATTARRLVWPNPLQLVSEVSHGLSLSLRLFGNIGGEALVAILVTAAVPYGMPLVIHVLGLVPAVVQPVVFTLLVSNFLAEAVHDERPRPRVPAVAPEVP